MLSKYFQKILKISKSFFINDSSAEESKCKLEIENMNEFNDEFQSSIERLKFASSKLLKDAKQKDELDKFYEFSNNVLNHIKKNEIDSESSKRIEEIVDSGIITADSLKGKLYDSKKKVKQHLREIKNEISTNQSKETNNPILTTSVKELGQSCTPIIDNDAPVLKEMKHNMVSLEDNLTSRISQSNSDFSNKLNQSNRDFSNKLNQSNIKIDNVEYKVSQNKKLINDGNQTIRNELSKLNKSIPDNLLKKDDFSFELDSKFKELGSLKELAEELESLPASNRFIKSELSNINDKLDNLPASSASTNKSTKVPEDIQAVDDLAKYMRDGVDLLENMSRLYVSKISDLEQLDKINEQKKNDIIKAEKNGIKQGESSVKLALAKKIADKFPSEFNSIKSVFEDVIDEKYVHGEIINVTNDNKNILMPYFSTELELTEYEVVTPAILIGEDIVFKAIVKELIKLPAASSIEDDSKDEMDATVKKGS